MSQATSELTEKDKEELRNLCERLEEYSFIENIENRQTIKKTIVTLFERIRPKILLC